MRHCRDSVKNANIYIDVSGSATVCQGGRVPRGSDPGTSKRTPVPGPEILGGGGKNKEVGGRQNLVDVHV